MLHESVDNIISSATRSFLGKQHGLRLGSENKAAAVLRAVAAAETLRPA